ncbi:hypothetical protein LXL04_013596 [Taraxacum kok-saghyz]
MCQSISVFQADDLEHSMHQRIVRMYNIMKFNSVYIYRVIFAEKGERNSAYMVPLFLSRHTFKIDLCENAMLEKYGPDLTQHLLGDDVVWEHYAGENEGSKIMG